jgi:hypothetical protein
MAEQQVPSRAVALRDLGALTLVSKGTTVLTALSIINAIAAAQFIQVFDAVQVADVTLGTTSPDFEISVPTSGSAIAALASGLRFMKGIVVASTTAEKGATSSGAGVQVFLGIY